MSEIKVHLHNLQHEFLMGITSESVNNKKYETNIEKERTADASNR